MSGARLSASSTDWRFGRLLAGLSGNWLRIIIAALAVTLFAQMLAWTATPQYRAEAIVSIEPRSAQADSRTQPSREMTMGLEREWLAVQMDIIASPDILSQVAEGLHLSATNEFDQAAALSVLDRAMIFLGLRSDTRDVAAQERVLQMMRKNLSVQAVEKTRLVSIEFASENAELAAAIPTAIAEAYVAFSRAAQLGPNSYAPVNANIVSRPAVPSAQSQSLVLAGAAFGGSLLIITLFTLLAQIVAERRNGQTAAQVEPVARVQLQSLRLEVSSDAPDAGQSANRDAASWHGEISFRQAVRRLTANGTQRVIFISADVDDGRTTVSTARELAASGRRVLLLDLSVSGSASTLMLEGEYYSGITNLLSSEAQFAEVIHTDHSSNCHVVPAGTADRTRAMLGVDRLPIVLNALASAYDVLVLDCGSVSVGSILPLDDDGRTAIAVSAGEPVATAHLAEEARAAGFGSVLVVMRAAAEPQQFASRTAA